MAAGTSTDSQRAARAPARPRWRWILRDGCGRRVAWYKIDAPDADPVIFFNYLIKSIQECRPSFGKKSLTS